MNKYIIQGIAVAFLDAEPHSRDEAEAYLAHASKKEGRLKSLLINRDGEHADLKYTIEAPPFERIRRITGYLTGTTDRWNSSKHAELDDRVAHDTNPQPNAEPQEQAQEAQEGPADAHEPPAIRSGDFALHKPTGEEWVVAGVNKEQNRLIPCGYPFPSMAKLDDCELTKSRGLKQTDEIKKALRQHGCESFIEQEEPAQ